MWKHLKKHQEMSFLRHQDYEAVLITNNSGSKVFVYFAANTSKILHHDKVTGYWKHRERLRSE